ncbi:MAG: PAS domain S-box protein [Sulfuritalea sp.]|nr:PAS domain S-box protein [Sulfuritalea sp.]MDP1982991.1 PAS domain S-box protein [Sulfuritalea sp.]
MAMNGTPPAPPATARNSRVAERKRAKHELRDSEETLRTIASSAQDAILMLDNEGRIALWNPAAERIFGYSSEEALGKDLHLLLVPKRFHEAHRAAFPRFRSTGEGAAVGKTLELAALRKDGTEFPIELSLSAVMLKDKWCAIGIVRDISERKKSEEHLRASEEQHRSLLAALAEGVVLQDASGALVMFNERAERMLGLTAAQLTGGLPIDPRWRAIHEDESAFPGDAHPAMTTLKTGVPQSDVIMGVRKPDGTLTWLSINTQALVKPGQTTPDGVVSSFRDITEHRTQEERLRLANAVIENSPAVLFRWRAAAGWPVEYVSNNVRQFGFTEEELLTGAVPFAQMVYREDMERVAAEVARYTAGGCERFAQEYRLVTRDGAVRWVDDRTTIERDAAGEVKHYQGVLTDITEKKRSELALYKVNRALKATSNCNMALIHATDEIRLLDEMCHIIVDAGGYRLAWVGYAEHDAAKTVKPVAHGGYEPGYMERADITWADDERGSGPVGIAIRGGQVQVVQDVQTDPRFERWRANAARLGYGSVLVAPLLSETGTIGALSIHAEGTDAFDEREIALLSELAADMAFGIVTLRARGAHEQSAARLLGSMEATIQVIGATVEMRDPYTAGHQLRVANLAAAIAQEMGLTEEQVHGIRLAGMVHDLGKVHIPSEILSKPGKLSRIEFELIKSHPEAGYEILKDVDFPWPIAQIVLQHHERLDGSGYPRGLKADEILLEARIMTVADVVEAMASHRPYRPALGIDLALREISENAGKYYDAEAVRICLALFREKAFAFNA